MNGTKKGTKSQDKFVLTLIVVAVLAWISRTNKVKNILTNAADKLNFKNEIYPTAIQLQGQYGIKPDITVAQAAHESNWGLSALSTEGKNLFGIIADDTWIKSGKPVWKDYPTTEYSKLPPNKIQYWDRPGDIVDKRDDGKGGSVLKVQRSFRAYRNWTESIMDWAKFLSSARYAGALEAAKQGNMNLFATALQKAGYATDPQYAASLTKVYDTVTSLEA